MKRPQIPSAIEIEILTRSSRRCALCFGIDKDTSEKQGQIAHLDKDSSNNSISNLAFLCLNHHDRYDSLTSQSKGYRKAEVIAYRDALYQTISTSSSHDQRFQDEVKRTEEHYQAVTDIEIRYFSLEASINVLEQQILARAYAVFEFIQRNNEWLEARPDNSLSDAAFEEQYKWHLDSLHKNLSIPIGVYGLTSSESALPAEWLETVQDLIPAWVSGEATYDECTALLWELDDRFDLDLHWILFGIPNSELPRLGYQVLINFVYVFGLRGQAAKRAEKRINKH